MWVHVHELTSNTGYLCKCQTARFDDLHESNREDRMIEREENGKIERRKKTKDLNRERETGCLKTSF